MFAQHAEDQLDAAISHFPPASLVLHGMSSQLPISSTSAQRWKLHKIWRIAREVKEAKRTDFISVINALLARQLLYNDEADARNSSYSEVVSASKNLLDLMLHVAKEFCADDSSQRFLQVRRYIRET